LLAVQQFWWLIIGAIIMGINFLVIKSAVLAALQAYFGEKKGEKEDGEVDDEGK
jgi:hypothetical protein